MTDTNTPTSRPINKEEAQRWARRLLEASTRLSSTDPKEASRLVTEVPPEHRFAPEFRRYVLSLIQAGVLSPSCPAVFSLFEEACREANDHLALQLLEAGLEFTSFGSHCYAPFHLSCLYGRKQSVEWMLHSANTVNWWPWKIWDAYRHPLVELASKNGERPLHLAAKSSNPEVVELLLRQGADALQRDQQDRLPLQLACREAGGSVIELFIQNGILDELSAWEAQYGLVLAAASGCLQGVKSLLREGISPNGMPPGKTTPLHAAARLGDLEIVNALLAHGARPDPQDARAATPLHDALRFGYGEIARTLVEAGAKLSIRDVEKRHPHDLIKAMESDELEAVYAQAVLEREGCQMGPKRESIQLEIQASMEGRSEERAAWLEKRFHAAHIPFLLPSAGVSKVLKDEGSVLGVQMDKESGEVQVFLLDSSVSQALCFQIGSEWALQSGLENLSEWQRDLQHLVMHLAPQRIDPTDVRLLGLRHPEEPGLYWPLQHFAAHCRQMALGRLINEAHTAQREHVSNYLTRILSSHGVALPLDSRGEVQDNWSYYGNWAYGSEKEACSRYLCYLKYELAQNLYLTLNSLLAREEAWGARVEELFVSYIAQRLLSGEDRRRIARRNRAEYRLLKGLRGMQSALRRLLVNTPENIEPVQRWCHLEIEGTEEARAEQQQLEIEAGVKEYGTLLWELEDCERQMTECFDRMQSTRRRVCIRQTRSRDWLRDGPMGLHLTPRGVLALGTYMGWWTENPSR